MPSRPTISVTIPIRNGGSCLETAIQSAFAQTDPPDEILAVDNCSTDETPSILAEHQSRLKVVRQRSPVSMAENWNTCIEQASSDFVMMLHADDELFPDAVRLVREVLRHHGDVDHIFGQTWLYDCTRSFPGLKETFGKLSADSYFLRACESCYHYCSGTTTRRDLARDLGGFDSHFWHIVDQDFFIRVGRAARAVFAIDAPLATYRDHLGNLHKTLHRDHTDDLEYVELLQKIVETYRMDETTVHGAQNLFGVACRSTTSALKDGDVRFAVEHARRCRTLERRLGAWLPSRMSWRSRLVNRIATTQAGARAAALLLQILQPRRLSISTNRAKTVHEILVQRPVDASSQ